MKIILPNLLQQLLQLLILLIADSQLQAPPHILGNQLFHPSLLRLEYLFELRIQCILSTQITSSFLIFSTNKTSSESPISPLVSAASLTLSASIDICSSCNFIPNSLSLCLIKFLTLNFPNTNLLLFPTDSGGTGS